jgi:predicted dehydrogenase
VGEIEHVMVHMASVTRELMSATGDYNLSSDITAPQPQTCSDPKLSGGGYGQAQVTHALGLSLWLTGLRGQEVFARMHDLGGKAPVELHDAISLSYTNGAIGTISGASAPAGAGADKHQVDVRIFGSEGQLLIDLEHERLWRYRTKDDDVLVDLPPNAGLYDCEGPPNTLVDLALGKDVPNNSPGELGARTVEILEAAYRSAASGVSEACRHADAVPA